MTPAEHQLIRSRALEICKLKYPNQPCDEPCDQCWASALRDRHNEDPHHAPPAV